MVVWDFWTINSVILDRLLLFFAGYVCEEFLKCSAISFLRLPNTIHLGKNVGEKCPGAHGHVFGINFEPWKQVNQWYKKANMPHKKYIKRNTLQGTNISHQWKRKQIFQLPMDGHLVGNVFFWSASQQLILQRFQLIVHESPTSYYNQHGLLYCMFPSQITRRVCVFWHLICPHLGWMLMFITRS